MKHKIETQPKYKAGDMVRCSLLEGIHEIIGSPKWNGFVWMYDIKGESLRCGEFYLTLEVEDY